MIPLYIPYVNRIDLLIKAYESAKGQGAEIGIIDNSPKSEIARIGRSWTITPKTPLTFSETQNYMLSMATKGMSPFYLFMHSDAEAGPLTVHRLIEMAINLTKDGRKWGAIWTAYDALAVFNTPAFNAVGGWDEQFTWYASDQDMYRRLRLAGYELIDSGLPVQHEPSQTLKADSNIAQKVAEGFAERVRLYVEKWGGEAGQERYLMPYNGKYHPAIRPGTDINPLPISGSWK